MKTTSGTLAITLLIGTLAGCRSSNVAAPSDTARENPASPEAVVPEPAASDPATAEKPPRPTKPVKHDAVGAKVTASSTHQEWPGEGPPEALVDGRLDTRWASEYSEPHTVVVDLGKAVAIDQIRLHWEAAFATRYTVSVSVDNKDWAKAHACLKAKSETEAAIDKISLNGLEARYLRIDLQKRQNPEWGFSLWEIEIIKK